MKIAATLLLALANLSWARTAFDCRYFDCVTPFLEGPPVPLPAASSIPQPAGWPGPPLTFTPLRATITGFVYGRVAGGLPPFTVDGPFLSDGTNTFFSAAWPDFEFIDLSNAGVILAAEGPGTSFLTNLRSARIPLGSVFEGSHEYLLGATGRALAMNDTGNAFLVTGVVKWQHANPSLPLLAESGLTMIWSDGFQPNAIPEPTTGLLVSCALVGLISLKKRQGSQRPGAARR